MDISQAYTPQDIQKITSRSRLEDVSAIRFIVNLAFLWKLAKPALRRGQ